MELYLKKLDIENMHHRFNILSCTFKNKMKTKK